VDGAGSVVMRKVAAVAAQSSAAWFAGIHLNGDVVAASQCNQGSVCVVRSRRANILALPVLISDAWEWKTGANYAGVFALAVHPTEPFAYLSISQQRAADSVISDDDAIIKFDLAKATPATPVDVIAFYNTPLNHYFISAGAGEIKSVESGGAGAGWARTSGGFKAYVPETGIPATALPVCRFYGTPGRGPNSHFYTFFGPECDAVKKDAGWSYEGIAFHIDPPSNGICAAGNIPVYRAYNNGFARNDSNHRYSTDQAALKAMTGWTIEGVVFCSPPIIIN
jgi:Repeat of unknown function (DUF5648)